MKMLKVTGCVFKMFLRHGFKQDEFKRSHIFKFWTWSKSTTATRRNTEPQQNKNLKQKM